MTLVETKAKNGNSMFRLVLERRPRKSCCNPSLTGGWVNTLTQKQVTRTIDLKSEVNTAKQCTVWLCTAVRALSSVANLPPIQNALRRIYLRAKIYVVCTCSIQEVWINGRSTPMILTFLNVLIESIKTCTLGLDDVDHTVFKTFRASLPIEGSNICSSRFWVAQTF